MRRILGLSFTVALALGAVGAVPATASDSENARANVSDEEATTLILSSATDVFTLEVTIPEAGDGAGRNGRLTVDTIDCCIAGDIWGVRIIKANGKVIAEGTGDGSITAYSGAASIPSIPGKTVTVEVFYVSGTDVFP